MKLKACPFCAIVPVPERGMAGVHRCNHKEDCWIGGTQWMKCDKDIKQWNQRTRNSVKDKND